MSTPLTDGINALTAYANEVTGESNQTLSDAVESLVAGYGQGGGELSELDIYAGLNASLQNVSFAQTLKNLNVIGTIANSTLGKVPSPLFLNDSVEVITVNYNSGWKPATCTDAFNGNNYQNLKRIIFNVDTSNVGAWDRFLSGNNQSNQGFEFLGQPLDFTKMSRWTNTINIAKLKEIRFAPNTLSVSPTIAGDRSNMFSDETWISFANCFNGGVSGTATIGSDAISTISSIKGNVVNGLFVADENGTTTLEDFITTVKGWTLA